MTTDAVGGVWQYSLDLSRGLAELGIETVVALLGPPPSHGRRKAFDAIDGSRLLETGLPLDWLADRPETVRKTGEKLARIADEVGADIVQLNAPALAAGVAFDRPVVAVAHSCVATWWRSVKQEPLCDPYRWQAHLTAQGLSAADVAVAPSTAFASAIKDAHGLSDQPITVHNGRSRADLPELAQHDCAITAGRLWDKGKNVATLDRAAAKLQIPFYAAGPLIGPSGDSIQLDHVRSLGTVSDEEIARRLGARPLFVSAALYEPFGLAVLEAASAGCPLILSDIPTFRELWGGAAAFVDPMDADAFAERIALIVQDDFARAKMSAAARRRAGRYTVEAMSRNMASIYARLVSRSGRSSKVAA